MFDELSSRFEDAVKGLRGEAKISENNINDSLNQVKRALLDADVSLSVVKEFISDVKDKAIGEEVVRGVNPGQKFIEVVNKELINIMGNENSPLKENEKSPTVILMAGLQGAGKTTATGKLGLYLKEKDKKVLLVAADIYRPAAVEQLKTLGSQYDLEVFSAKEKNSKGFTLIEMIAAMVLVSILVPGVSSILGGTLMNIALTNLAILSNMEADHAQRKFIKHINGVKSFSGAGGDLAIDNLKFTSYGIDRDEHGNLINIGYEYEIDDSRKIKYKIIDNLAGILLKNVVKDTTIDAVNYVSKFTYRGKDNTDLGGTPTATDVYGVELTFYLLRGESFYKYTTYATIDEDQLDI